MNHALDMLTFSPFGARPSLNVVERDGGILITWLDATDDGLGSIVREVYLTGDEIVEAAMLSMSISEGE